MSGHGISMTFHPVHVGLRLLQAPIRRLIELAHPQLRPASILDLKPHANVNNAHLGLLVSTQVSCTKTG